MELQENKKQKFHPAVFLLTLVLILGIAGTVLTPSFFESHGILTNGLQCCSGLMRQPDNSIDVIVTGDSESYTSISPMELWKNYGITSYVAGKPGAKISETKDILEVALRHQKPKVVLLETNNLFRYRASNSDAQTSELADIIYRIFPFLKYHNVWKNITLAGNGNTFMGFKFNANIAPYTGRRTGKTVTGNRITPATLRYLDDIQKMCKKSGARLILYSAPSPKCYTAKKTRLLKKLCRKRGLAYINLNSIEKDLGINWLTDTRDRGDHLNTAGALKVSDYMGNYLSTACGIPNRSHTVLARSWNRLYRTYARSLESTLKTIEINAVDEGFLEEASR